MPNNYQGNKPREWTPQDGMPSTDNPRVTDVARGFGRLRSVGDYLAATDAGLIPGRKYTETNFGDNRSKNHYQVVQRIGPPDDCFLFVSGGDVVAVRRVDIEEQSEASRLLQPVDHQLSDCFVQ